MLLTSYHADSTDNIKNIRKLFLETFSDSEGADEGNVIGNLVENILTTTPPKDLHIFVATEQTNILGCIIFSPLYFENEENILLLSPVAISTKYQKQGIGQKLIKHAFNELLLQGITSVITYGDINFYSKVGFKQISEDIIKAPLNLSYPDGWLGVSLNNKNIIPISDKPTCIDALNNQSYW